MEPAEAKEDKQKGERIDLGVAVRGEDYRSGFHWNKVIF